MIEFNITKILENLYLVSNNSVSNSTVNFQNALPNNEINNFTTQNSENVLQHSNQNFNNSFPSCSTFRTDKVTYIIQN